MSDQKETPARLFMTAYLVNDDIIDEREIAPQDLIDKFIGDDTGAPLLGAAFTLETSDGHKVDLGVQFPKQRRTGPRIPATEMFAYVRAMKPGEEHAPKSQSDLWDEDAPLAGYESP
jgi:hypothetical protein